MSQAELKQRGHAIEARVYAEDPANGFLPQAGRLLLYREPRMPGVRIDSGVREGDVVSVHYDPLLAKVIAYAETRDVALARLLVALRGFPILGILTNIPFLIRVLEDPHFTAGGMHTSFLDNEGAHLAHAAEEAMPPFVSAALETSEPVQSRLSPGPTAFEWDPWLRLPDWRAP